MSLEGAIGFSQLFDVVVAVCSKVSHLGNQLNYLRVEGVRIFEHVLKLISGKVRMIVVTNGQF